MHVVCVRVCVCVCVCVRACVYVCACVLHLMTVLAGGAGSEKTREGSARFRKAFL